MWAYPKTDFQKKDNKEQQETQHRIIESEKVVSYTSVSTEQTCQCWILIKSENLA